MQVTNKSISSTTSSDMPHVRNDVQSSWFSPFQLFPTKSANCDKAISAPNMNQWIDSENEEDEKLISHFRVFQEAIMESATKWFKRPENAAKRVEEDLKHSTSCVPASHADSKDESHAEKIDASVTKNSEQLKQPIFEAEMNDCENHKESKLKPMITRGIFLPIMKHSTRARATSQMNEKSGLEEKKETIPQETEAEMDGYKNRQKSKLKRLITRDIVLPIKKHSAPMDANNELEERKETIPWETWSELPLDDVSSSSFSFGRVPWSDTIYSPAQIRKILEAFKVRTHFPEQL